MLIDNLTFLWILNLKKKFYMNAKYFERLVIIFLILQVSREILKCPWFIDVDKCDLIYGWVYV